MEPDDFPLKTNIYSTGLLSVQILLIWWLLI